MRHACCSLLLLLSLCARAQTPEPEGVRLRVMSYNVENAFDCRDDSLTADEEYLPEAARHWHRGRYWTKLEQIARVIAATGQEELPCLVGLCEVENDTVLHDLTRRSPLRQAGYRYVMTHSPDVRGINVALLYQRTRFRPVSRHSIRIPVAEGQRPTRDLLHVSGKLANGDTLDVFVVHLPSKLQGKRRTLPYRLKAAGLLRQTADSLRCVRRRPQILLMGDFNDTATSEVLQLLTADGSYHSLVVADSLPREVQGSYQYQGRWQLIDHLLASASLLAPEARLRFLRAGTCHLPFLLTEDERYGGWRPLRTYRGYRYEGGYSDHLPVWADFEMRF